MIFKPTLICRPQLLSYIFLFGVSLTNPKIFLQIVNSSQSCHTYRSLPALPSKRYIQDPEGKDLEQGEPFQALGSTGPVLPVFVGMGVKFILVCWN